MSIYRGRYYSASGCDSSAKPGTRALMSWFLGAYGDRDAANLGTYACKRLGSGWSIHAERRAADMGTSPYGGVDSRWGWALANALRLHSAELGIQLIILGDRIWSCRHPDAGWRPYGGAYHRHVHTELTPVAARNLTAAEIEDVIGGGTTSMIGLRKGDQGQRVKGLQSKLRRAGFDPGPVDGDYGSKTSATVLKMRKAQGSGVESGDFFSGWANTQLDQALADRRAEAAASEVLKAAKRATDKAIADLVANLPTTGADVPSHIVLDLPDEIRVPVEAAGDDD